MKTNRELEKQLKNKLVQEMGNPHLHENGLDLLKEEVRKVAPPKKRFFRVRFASVFATLLIALIAIPAVHLIFTADLKGSLTDNQNERPSNDYFEENDPKTDVPESNDPKAGDSSADDSLNESGSEIREGTGRLDQEISFWYYYAGGAALLLIGCGAVYMVAKYKKE